MIEGFIESFSDSLSLVSYWYFQGPGIDFPGNDPQYQYSFVGPLSMSKGCDRTIELSPNGATIPEFVYRGN